MPDNPKSRVTDAFLERNPAKFHNEMSIAISTEIKAPQENPPNKALPTTFKYILSQKLG